MLLPPALGSSPHPPVSVCGTGPHRAIAAFLDGMSALFATILRSASRRRAILSRLAPSSRVPAVLPMGGAGIYACCPSATPLGLALGPDLPGADQLYPGILGYSAMGIPTPFSLLIPAFSLPSPPRLLSVPFRRVGDAPLPGTRRRAPQASVSRLSPGHFRRGTSRLVSYYALFERVAASEPTS